MSDLLLLIIGGLAFIFMAHILTKPKPEPPRKVVRGLVLVEDFMEPEPPKQQAPPPPKEPVVMWDPMPIRLADAKWKADLCRKHGYIWHGKRYPPEAKKEEE